MFVLGETPTIAYVMRIIAKEWNQFATPKVLFHYEGYFGMNFASFEVRNEILNAGPQFFMGNQL